MDAYLPHLSPLNVVLGLSVTFLVTFILRYYSTFQLWTSQDIPNLNAWLTPFRFATISSFSGKELGEYEKKHVSNLGTIYGTSDFLRMCLFVADAAALKEVLVRDFRHFMARRDMMDSHPVARKFLLRMKNQEWKQTRQILTPTFTSGKMKSMFPLMKQSLESMMEVFHKKSGQDLDVLTTFGNFTMDVIAKTAFAVETNGHKNPNDPFIHFGKTFFTIKRWKRPAFFFLPRFITYWMQLNLFDDASTDFLTKLAAHMINERRTTGKTYHDFLDLLISAGKDEKESNSTDKKTLTDEEIISNIILFLAAGYHTTSMTLTHASFMMATHPDVQEKARQEVLKVMEQNDGVLDYEVINSLTYLEAVINETLRMCPAVVHVERECSEDYILKVDTPRLGQRDILIPKGAGIEIPIYAIHHMEEYFPEPYKFRPERFLPENKDKLVPYTFLAFVAGPRNCIGMRFAMLELKMALANILSKFEITTSPKTAIPIVYKKSTGFLLQPEEVILRLKEI